MHEAGERRQVCDVKVIGFVQHQIASQQPQHGRNLLSTTQAFRRGREVVHSTDQDGCREQRTHLGIVRHALQQRVAIIAFEQHLTTLVQQALAGCGAAGFGLLLPVLKQSATRCASHLDGQLLIAQSEIVLKAATCLQGECAQADGECTAHSQLRIRQRVHDARVAQCLAASGGGHVDHEAALTCSPIAHTACKICRLVLPLKSRVRVALFQAAMVFQRRKAVGQRWQ